MSKQAGEVIYYLCRGGELEHPHSIDVSYLDSDGLLLRDVKKSLVAIRGKGMPDLYSWSYKRSYKEHFIWHDVSDNDAILPINNTEFILKGSEVVAKGNSSELSNPDSGEIQYKKVLRDACLTKPVKECRNIISEVVNKPELGFLDLQVQAEEQCRGEKPLPPCPSFSDRRKLAPCPEKQTIAAPLPETCLLKPSDVKARKSTGSSILRHMLPCGDVKVEVNNNYSSSRGARSSFNSSSHDAVKPPDALRWKHGAAAGSTRHWKQAAKLPSCAAPEEAKKPVSATQEYVNSRGGTPNNNLHGYTLPRYLPRYSFSNVSCLDSYDLYLRPEKVKQVDNGRQGSTHLSTESLYEVDFTNERKNSTGGDDDFFFKCESPQVISKLVQEAKARDDEKARSLAATRETAAQRKTDEELGSNKSKLDWDKNFQEAVDMIIHPPALVSSSSL